MIENSEEDQKFGLAISGSSLPIIYRYPSLSDDIAFIF